MYENDTISPVKIAYSGESVWERAILAYQLDTSLLRSNSPDDQVVGWDNFSFRVLDLDGNRSFPAPVTIKVHTGVFTESNGRVQCYEDEDCDIILFGTALDDSEANMAYTVTDVPLYGKVFDAAKGTIIEPGMTLSKQSRYPYQDGVAVVYRPPHDFFNDPDVTWLGDRIEEDNDTEAVSFFASLVEGDAVLSSTVFRQTIKVTNVDDTSKLVCSGEKNLQVRATATDKEFNYSRPDRVALNDISIDSEYDKAVDPVRIDITIYAGNVFLNPRYRDRMDFSLDCAGIDSSWKCQEISIIQKTMTFIGAPEDAARSLSGMVYFNQYQHVSSSVVIKMYDGEGGLCIGSRGFSTISVRPECETSSCTFQVEVGSLYGIDDEEEEKGWIRLNLTTLKVIFVSAFVALTLVLIRINLMLLKYLFRLVCPCIKLDKKKDEKKAAGDDAVKTEEQPVSPAAKNSTGANNGKKGVTRASRMKIAVIGEQAKEEIFKGSSQRKPPANIADARAIPKKSTNANADDAEGNNTPGRRNSISPPKGSAEKPSASDKDGHGRDRRAVDAQGWTD